MKGSPWFLLINIIIALPLIVWLYRDARGRDYNWVLWSVVPGMIIFAPSILALLVYTPLIIILYIILRPKGTLHKCPHCTKKIHPILVICPFCQKEAKRECLHCHEPVDWEATQCPFCKSRALTKGGSELK